MGRRQNEKGGPRVATKILRSKIEGVWDPGVEFTLDYLRGRGITPDPATEKAAAALRRKIQNATND